MSQTFHSRHSNSEVTLVTCWNIHGPASAPFHQVLWTQRSGGVACMIHMIHAWIIHPTSYLTWKRLSLGFQWPQRKVKMGMRCLPGSSVTCMMLRSMDPDWWFYSGCRGGDALESSEMSSVEDLRTWASAHRLSGWQPGMSTWLHCPCPCSLREVWNRQLWSDSSFQNCLWERRMKKAIRRAETPSQMPIFPRPTLPKPRYSL